MLIKVDWNSKKSLKEAVAPKLNDNFWKWFGNSKVVDNQGNPLVCYHGTTSKFDIFNNDKPIWVTPKEKYASMYSDDENIKALYVKLENPANLGSINMELDEVKAHKLSLATGISEYELNYIWQKVKGDSVSVYALTNSKEFKEALIERGFDGIEAYEGPNKSYAVFNPNQIKSVNNNGNWSTTSDNINEEIAYAESNDGNLKNIILINPSRKELKDNNLLFCRYCYDKDGNYYFGSDYEYTHNDIMLNIKKEKGIQLYDDMGFYDTNENCFYKRYYVNGEDYNEVLKSEKATMKNNWILTHLFGDFDVKLFDGEYPEEDNLYEWWSGGVNWQNDRKGLGGVGATQDCHLFFFMFPDQFLNLCPKFSYGDDKFFNQYVADRKPMGIPFLWCEVDEKNKTLKVLDHEGRHRIKAIRDYALSKGKSQPDIPVAIIYNKDKYSLPYDISELRKTWKIVSQNGDMSYNIGMFRVQNNLDNQIVGVDNLYESTEYLEVYHGSPNVFKKFDKRKLGTSTKEFEDGNYTSTGYGFFFTDDKEYASGYGKNIYSCKIKLDNPLVVDMSRYIATEMVISRFLNQAKKENKDGVIFKNIREVGRNPSTEYVVFDTKNIKIIKKLNEANEPQLNDNFWKWFGDSKSIKDGQPMIFYHGTPNAFTTFDISKTSPYGTVGQGFYFTDSKQTAEQYIGGILDRKTNNSHVKSCYLRMIKPYNFDDIISDSELASLSQWVASNNEDFWYKKILDDSKYNEKIKYPQGWNFEEGYLVPADQINREGITRAINWLYKVKALDNNNLSKDNVWFVLTDGFNTNASKRSLQKWLKQNKYDSVIYPIEGDNKGNGTYKNYCYVVFDPNQIKSVENKGLYSLENNNINETLTEASNINENFWNWFKGSKTVDEQGNPLIFYHGTKQPNITNFKAKYSDGLVFFAYNEEFAKEWASNAPLTPEQEQNVRDFQSSDDLANYRKEVMARYKRDYGDNWADDDDLRKSVKWEIKEFEKQKYKQMGIEENVIPVYIKATKIFNPARDYSKVIKEIADHWELDLKSDYKQELEDSRSEYKKVEKVINKWFEEHSEYKNDPAMEQEFRKREDILTNALNKYNLVRDKINQRNEHLKRIMSGAWVYFENKETIDKIWELGYDAIELSEHSGVITTLAVREGTNQVKSIFNFGNWGNGNIFESK